MAPRSSAKYAFEWHHPRVLEIVENNNRVSMRQTSGDTSAPVEALGFLGIQSPEKNLCSQPELHRALASSKAYSNLNCSNAAETSPITAHWQSPGRLAAPVLRTLSTPKRPPSG
ncbi:predicted protein [Histoplasma capsulatum G186AR]|uniref:Uncharacterized protein n=1 Tax=Ajellomyces capsulatus (strain G186AR / H82 / ATCC MYA-2454 / RMSCC 2432) TaxID=447093 RepID=C0NWJ8_AJECG|nr:uncharacterized protein HCBG_07528 [Histoplasma capsulatum G186AR]EEH04303.1 predicted protein [Histoplasma capsulatum G186AR]